MELETMLRHGLGRAVRILEKEQTASRWRGLIWRACREDWRFDQQCEEGRAPYLFDVLHATGEPGYYAARLAALLEPSAPASAGADYGQMMHVAALLTRNGDADLRDVIYRAFADWAPKGHTIGADALLILDGVAGYRFLAEQFSRYPLPEDDQWQETFWLDNLAEQFGEKNLSLSLELLARSRADLAPYVRRVRQARTDEKAKRERERQQLFAPAPAVTYQEVRAFLESPGEKTYSSRRFGARMDEATALRIAADLASETTLLRQMRIVRLFRPRKEPYPGPPETLLALIRQTDDERLARWAVYPLEKVAHPAIREAALQMARMPERIPHAARLLAANPGPRDVALLETLAARDQTEAEFHNLGIGLRSYCEKNLAPELIPLLRRLYERMACSWCRHHTVEMLIELDALPPQIHAECRYDCYPETRALAAKVARTA